MSRIRELQITSQLFDRELPKDFSITPVYKEEYNTPVFILHFSEKIAYKVYDEFQEKYIKKLDDGTLEVTFRYHLSDWTFLYLLFKDRIARSGDALPFFSVILRKR